MHERNDRLHHPDISENYLVACKRIELDNRLLEQDDEVFDAMVE